MNIIDTLHPEDNLTDNLYPNIKKENIPSKAINLSKLSPEVLAKLPKVINTGEVSSATKLKYLEIDGIIYSIPDQVDITANIKITGNKDDILGTTEHNKLCILSNTGDLSFKVVDKVGKIEEISTLSEVLPQALQASCCATYGDNIYIFGGSGSDKVNTIYKYNCTSKTISKLSATLPKALTQLCCSIYQDNIYIFGGMYGNYSQNTIYKFNCTNETILTLSVTLPGTIRASSCGIYEDNIYIFGGNRDSGSSVTKLNTIYKFNCSNETITTLSVYLPQALSYACCATYGDNIYIFGGSGSSGTSKTIYKFNCVTETIETLSETLPQVLEGACCSISGDNVYIFGGFSSSYVNTIYKFNCSTETSTTLTITLPNKLCYACCCTFGTDIFIFGGYNRDTSSNVNTIFEFATSFELTANNVLIYNANSDYSFDLITDQVTIPIKNIYIGDSNNTAQLANAYLYDETQTAWVNVNTGEVLTL